MGITPQSLLATAKGMAGQLSAWRRDFHMYPELGMEERRAAFEAT